MSAGTQWISLASAADILGTTAPALRKALDAGATLGTDGVVEAEANGIRGRKQGRTWRILLAPSGGERGRSQAVSSPRRGRSFVVTMTDATATAGRREVTAKIVETDTPLDQADRLGLRLAPGVLDLVAEILVEMVREDEGRDGAAAIVDRRDTGP